MGHTYVRRILDTNMCLTVSPIINIYGERERDLVSSCWQVFWHQISSTPSVSLLSTKATYQLLLCCTPSSNTIIFRNALCACCFGGLLSHLDMINQMWVNPICIYMKEKLNKPKKECKRRVPAVSCPNSFENCHVSVSVMCHIRAS